MNNIMKTKIMRLKMIRLKVIKPKNIKAKYGVQAEADTLSDLAGHQGVHMRKVREGIVRGVTGAGREGYIFLD